MIIQTTPSLLSTIEDPKAIQLARNVKQIRDDLNDARSQGLDYFLLYQKRWIDASDPFEIGEKARRIGFTYGESYNTVERRQRGICNKYFSSADETASREFIDYCKVWCEVFNTVATYSDETEVIDEQEMRTKVLTFGNGRKVVAGTSNPTFFRSKGGDASADEYAFHQRARELLKAAQATAISWGYQLRAFSTHNGAATTFNGLVQDARKYEDFLAAGGVRSDYKGKRIRLHRVTILDAVEQGIVEKIKRLKKPDAKARQEWLDELRYTCVDEDSWREEFLVEPRTEHGSLMSYELIQACEELNLSVADTVDYVAKIQAANPSARLFLGYDVGRKHDRSVLWIWEQIGDVYWLRVKIVLKDTPYSIQEGLINSAMAFHIVRRGAIDATGIGNDLAERLVRRWGSRIEAVMFTNAVKSDIAMTLVRIFQDRRARIHSDDGTREALHKIKRTVTAAGNIRLDADRDDEGHADEFWAACLALHAADDTELPLPPPLARKPEGF